jgi:AraC-like DNA-binding protein
LNIVDDLFPYQAVAHSYADSIVYPPGGRYGPRVQNDIQLVLLHTGHMEIDIDGERIPFEPGHVVLLKPGHQEQFQFSNTKETWHRWIAIRFSTLSPEAYQYLDALPLCLPISEELNRLTDLAISSQHYNDVESGLQRSLGLAALNMYFAESNRFRQRTSMHPSVHQAKKLIHTRYADNLPLAELAYAVGLTPEHLVRLFRQHEKTTPIKYLWNYRIIRGIELLVHSGLSVSEISIRCGFQTSYHFARKIKESVGHTPTNIRSTAWKVNPIE